MDISVAQDKPAGFASKKVSTAVLSLKNSGHFLLRHYGA